MPRYQEYAGPIIPGHRIEEKTKNNRSICYEIVKSLKKVKCNKPKKKREKKAHIKELPQKEQTKESMIEQKQIEEKRAPIMELQPIKYSGKNKILEELEPYIIENYEKFYNPTKYDEMLELIDLKQGTYLDKKKMEKFINSNLHRIIRPYGEEESIYKYFPHWYIIDNNESEEKKREEAKRIIKQYFDLVKNRNEENRKYFNEHIKKLTSKGKQEKRDYIEQLKIDRLLSGIRKKINARNVGQNLNLWRSDIYLEKEFDEWINKNIKFGMPYTLDEAMEIIKKKYGIKEITVKNYNILKDLMDKYIEEYYNEYDRIMKELTIKAKEFIIKGKKGLTPDYIK